MGVEHNFIFRGALSLFVHDKIAERIDAPIGEASISEIMNSRTLSSLPDTPPIEQSFSSSPYIMRAPFRLYMPP